MNDEADEAMFAVDDVWFKDNGELLAPIGTNLRSMSGERAGATWFFLIWKAGSRLEFRNPARPECRTTFDSARLRQLAEELRTLVDWLDWRS